MIAIGVVAKFPHGRCVSIDIAETLRTRGHALAELFREAGLPAIGAALEALPDNAIGKVFIEVGGPDDEIPLTAPPGVEVNWIYRGGRADLVPEDQAGENAPLIAAMKEGRLAAWAGAGLHSR